MPRIKLSQIAVGMLLDEDIYDEKGILLISKGKALEHWHIDLLIRNHIFEVAVLEEKNAFGEHFSTANLSLGYRNAVARFKSVYENVKLGKLPIVEEIEEIFEQVLREIENEERVLEMFMILDRFDDCLYEHSVFVSLLCGLLSDWLGRDEQFKKRAVLAGLFHDIGKSNVPQELLEKKEELSVTERAVMRMHPLFGYSLCKEIFSDRPDILCAIRDHHERIDGSGYPNRIAGGQISDLAHIVAICNSFVGMSEKRFGVSPLHPLAVLSKMKYENLHSKFTSVFISKTLPRFLGMKVELSIGTSAEILQCNPEFPDRPVVYANGKNLDLANNKGIHILLIHEM